MIGQGSAGRRHAQILLNLGHDVAAHDPFTPVLPGAVSHPSLEAALDGADAAVIASPSAGHASQTRRTLERDIPTLVEKPLATDARRARTLALLADQRRVPLAVAMNLRHHPSILRLRSLLPSLGRVYRASAWCGSYLPDWHPGADYSTGYSAQAAQGGGVLLDVAVHELDYLMWLLGPIVAVTATIGQVSDLEIDVEDCAALLLELATGAVVTLVVDYLDHDPTRGCRIVGERGTIAESVLPYPDAYTAQMEFFLAWAAWHSVGKGTQTLHATAADAYNVLRVIDCARVSATQGKRVEVPW